MTGTLVGMLPLPPPLHLGGLHAHEQVLVAVLAFGPFVVLAVVVAVVRRRDRAADRAAERDDEPPARDGQRDR